MKQVSGTNYLTLVSESTFNEGVARRGYKTLRTVEKRLSSPYFLLRSTGFRIH